MPAGQVLSAGIALIQEAQDLVYSLKNQWSRLNLNNTNGAQQSKQTLNIQKNAGSKTHIQTKTLSNTFAPLNNKIYLNRENKKEKESRTNKENVMKDEQSKFSKTATKEKQDSKFQCDEKHKRNSSKNNNGNQGKILSPKLVHPKVNVQIVNNNDDIQFDADLIGGGTIDQIQDERTRQVMKMAIVEESLLRKTDAWKQELQNDYNLHLAIGDGACLFSSLSLCLNLDPSLYSHLIRRIICDGLEDTIGAPEMETFVGRNFHKYIEEMRMEKTYGTHLEMATFCRIFECAITLFTVDNFTGSTNKGNIDDYGKGDTIFLRLVKDPKFPQRNHYDCLTPKMGNNFENTMRRVLLRIENLSIKLSRT